MLEWNKQRAIRRRRAIRCVNDSLLSYDECHQWRFIYKKKKKRKVFCFSRASVTRKSSVPVICNFSRNGIFRCSGANQNRGNHASEAFWSLHSSKALLSNLMTLSLLYSDVVKFNYPYGFYSCIDCASHSPPFQRNLIYTIIRYIWYIIFNDTHTQSDIFFRTLFQYI